MIQSGADLLLQVNHIHKTFDHTKVLHDICIEVSKGEIVCLLGPSGCGKSTLLNIIAGLVQADEGSITLDRLDISHTPVHQRGFGLMFQGLALFPHKNVADNVAFGLRMARHNSSVIRQRVTEVLNLVGLSGFEKRDVNQLSGGEQQRVALARSLAPRPKLLMLDEPLSSLDRALRERLMEELRVILTQVGQTAIYVTHDQQEAYALSDRMVILDSGHVAQTGVPYAIFHHPANVFVAQFLGQNNLIEGTIKPDYPNQIITKLGTFETASPCNQQGTVMLLIRADGATVADHGNSISGMLSGITFRGTYTQIILKTDVCNLYFDLDSEIPLPPIGSTLTLTIRKSAITCLAV